MKKLLLSLVILSACFNLKTFASELPTAQSIWDLTKKVSDWQINTFEDHLKYRAISTSGYKSTEKYHDLQWHMGALYAGMNEWRKLSGDKKATDFLLKIGKRNNWKLHNRPYHADDHTVGQFYLSLYEDFKDPEMIGPTRERFDWILANPKTGSLDYDGYGNPNTDWLDRWGWCDALFMAPPVLARLAKVTGETKYLDFMDQEYHVAYDLLWDEEDELFWRDTSFFQKREKNGKKLYWSRGNGWVFGGLALMIPDLPEDWEGRQFYIDLFKTMASSIKNSQREDATWSMGMLGGVEGYPIKETSGTAFFVFGLAWGINNGILDRETYEPIVRKAYHALEASVTEEGLLGYVQPVGAAPGDSFADKTEVYGIGAFLAAGTEVYRLYEGEVSSEKNIPTSAATDQGNLAFARHVPERLDDFAWENDRIAFRVYGPALGKKEAKNTGSGVDVWVKKVRYSVINKWYASNDYHEDRGEGADFYSVGATRGCGGTAIWRDGALHSSGTWSSYRIIQDQGEKIEFELIYEPWSASELTVSEVKHITMKRGENLFKVESRFQIQGGEEAMVAVGLYLGDGKGELSHSDRWMTYSDTLNSDNGKIFTAVVMTENAEFVKTKEHALMLVPVKNGDVFVYHAGAGWSKGLDFKSSEDWMAYIKSQVR
jgi:rhamnogalacturonyl hydrolase YesR